MFEIRISVSWFPACDCGECPGREGWGVIVKTPADRTIIGPFKSRDLARAHADRLAASIDEALAKSGVRYVDTTEMGPGTFPTRGGNA